MIFYEHDAQGFLVGWYDAITPRTLSTDVAPTGSLGRAKWNGTAWTEDPSRELARETEKVGALALLTGAKAALASFDKDTATADQTRKAVAALIRLLIKDD